MLVLLKMDATKLLLTVIKISVQLTHVMIISVVKIRNMLMLYVMIITHVQKIPVTMKLDVFTLILALNVKLKTNVILTIVIL